MRINFVVLKIRIEALCGPAETGSTLCSNKPQHPTLSGQPGAWGSLFKTGAYHAEPVREAPW
jgi:hypothetical protein